VQNILILASPKADFVNGFFRTAASADWT